MGRMKELFGKGFVLPVTALCLLMLPLSAAQAALVTYSFTGSIPGTAISSEIPVSGSFQFDNATGGSGGAYHGAVKDLTVTIGSYTASFASGANAVMISKNIPMGGGSGDRWALTSAVTGTELAGTNGNLFTPFSFDLRLDQKGGGLFATTDLQAPPSFSSIGSTNLTAARWRLFFEDADGNPAVYLGTISSVTAVPLPAAVLLFGAGLISLVGLGAGGVRNFRRSQA